MLPNANNAMMSWTHIAPTFDKFPQTATELYSAVRITQSEDWAFDDFALRGNETVTTTCILRAG